MSTKPTELYTQEQINYVSGLKDEELREHLLYQVRLRDNMEADRNAFEKIANTWPSTEKAISKLKSELGKDKSEGSYYCTWQANIAMAFKDEFYRYAEVRGISATARNFNIHEIANKAAENFLDLLCAE